MPSVISLHNLVFTIHRAHHISMNSIALYGMFPAIVNASLLGWIQTIKIPERVQNWPVTKGIFQSGRIWLVVWAVTPERNAKI